MLLAASSYGGKHELQPQDVVLLRCLGFRFVYCPKCSGHAVQALYHVVRVGEQKLDDNTLQQRYDQALAALQVP